MKTLNFNLMTYAKKQINLKLFTIVCLNVNCLALFFTPLIQVAALNEQNNFFFSCFSLLINPSFSVILNPHSTSLNFPVFTQFFCALLLILNASTLVLTIMKKVKIAAICFFASSCLPLVFLPAINELKNNLTDLQISSNKIFIEFLWPFFLLILFNLTCSVLCLLLIGKEHLAKTLFLSMTCLSVCFITVIVIYMACSGLPAINKIGLFNFLFKTKWNPASNQFGIFYLIKASLFATTGAILISAPVGVLTAVFMAEFCPKKLLFFIKPLIELLAGVPSVVFGFFGMIVIVPAIRTTFASFTATDGSPIVGDSLLAVIIVLTIMILPTIVSTAFTALKTVPRSFKEASLGLGATETKTIFKICIPAAKPAIISGLILAVGKAIGETMAVIMVAGNIVKNPEILGTVRLLTTGIAMDLGYASGLLKNALSAIGLVLLILIIAVNFCFNSILRKGAFSVEHNK